MALSFRTSVTSTLPSHEELIRQASIPTTALDFLYALTTGEFEIYTSKDGVLDKTTARVAGCGGYATVEIGTTKRPHKHLVAVKRSLMQWDTHQLNLPQNSKKVLGKGFEQVVRELRILGHKRARSHDNIINLEGVYMDEINGVPSLALVMELSLYELIDLAIQSGRGLDALHNLRVCHADVKVDNALVFKSPTERDGKNCWIVKISDLGQSIIACRDDPDGRVPYRPGTRLLEAPEIRRGQAFRDPGYDIQAALRTDVFSFGLFVWEVMKNGRGYFDPAWTGLKGRQVDTDTMEDFLNNLPDDGLLPYGTEFAKSFDQQHLSERLLRIFEGSLRDQPQTRRTMGELMEAFELPSDECEDKNAISDLSSDLQIEFAMLGFDADDESSIGTWGTSKSFYDLSDRLDFFGPHNIISDIPILLQRNILAELKGMAVSDSTETHSSGHSAMTVAECYTIGFGGSHDNAEVVQWLGTAASKGFKKAGLLYHRVCQAVDFPPQDINGTDEGKAIETALEGIPTEKYMSERILHHSRSVIEVARKKIFGHQASSLPAMAVGDMFLSAFNETKTDTLLPLHAASWLGEEALVAQLLESTPPDAQSALGFNAAHFACLGGHISILKLLIKHKVPLLAANFQLITPLHLTIFFQAGDLASTVHLLLEHGCSLEAGTHTVNWDAHDLSMYGTPIQWALQARNRTLVHILLPLQAQCPSPAWLDNVIQDFYWELLEDLLPYFQDVLDEAVTLQRGLRPYIRWIAHGRDYAQAIEKTVRLCHDNGLLGFDANGRSQLQLVLISSRSLADFLMFNSALDVSSADYVRYRTPDPYISSLIDIAFQHTAYQEALRDTLSRLVDYYTLDELEDGRLTGDENLLGVAVSYDNVIGARLLLERGVDVNKSYTVAGISIMNPIRRCLIGGGLPEMLSLLVEYGADLMAKCPVTGLTPLQLLLVGPIQVNDILNILTKYSQPDQVYIEALYRSFTTFFYATIRHSLDPSPDSQESKKPQLRTHHLGQFCQLLMDPRFTRFIDEPHHQDGSTMIQQAASTGHYSTVRLLLDAGADASRPFRRDNMSILPLQLATLKGRLLQSAKNDGMDHIPGLEYMSMDLVMKVATEVLRWHLARSDGLFDGITELHIACSMMYAESIRKYLEAGQSMEAKGYWPGIENMVTPRELALHSFWKHQADENMQIYPIVKKEEFGQEFIDIRKTAAGNRIVGGYTYSS